MSKQNLQISMSFIKTVIISLFLIGVQCVMASNDTLRIGVLIPQSGPAGLFGPSSQNFSLLAAKQINEKGGILGKKVELFFTDVGTPPAEAKQAVLRSWKKDKIDAFIGMHDSAVREALIGLFKGKIPYVYTATYEGGECSIGTYVLGETPEQQLKNVIPWMIKNKKVKKWYLIGNDYNWPRNTNIKARDYIESSGGEIVGEEYLSFTVDNFDTSLSKIKSSGAQIVLMTLVGGLSVSFNRIFADFGLDKTILRLGTLIEKNTLLGIGKQNSDGLYSSSGYFANINTKAARLLIKDYEKEYGYDAPPLNALGESIYEAIFFLKALFKRAGGFDVKKTEEYAEGTEYRGPRGYMKMSRRHITSNIYLAEAKGTDFQVVQTFKNISTDSCR